MALKLGHFGKFIRNTWKFSIPTMDGKDQLDRHFEEWRSITQRQEGHERPT